MVPRLSNLKWVQLQENSNLSHGEKADKQNNRWKLNNLVLQPCGRINRQEYTNRLADLKWDGEY